MLRALAGNCAALRALNKARLAPVQALRRYSLKDTKIPDEEERATWHAYHPSGLGFHVEVGRAEIMDKLGVDLANDPLFNKGTAFTPSERDRLSLRGLIPPRVCDIETQRLRVLSTYNKLPSMMEKYQFLVALQDRNETLFYNILTSEIKDMAPVIYTPTVGEACQKFGQLYRRRRGMYFSTEDRGNFKPMTYNWPADEVDIIVVTDGGRILGLGDLGANGMGIPIGKLSLYIAGAGIHPGRTLPVLLDVGTNNPELLSDPLYLGLPHSRLEGDEYYDMVDEFLEAIYERWPGVLVQFEDFPGHHAVALLEKYRDKLLCFNDDIQGTGAVILAGVLNAIRAAGKKESDLRNLKIVCLGAGSAGIGVCDAIINGMQVQGAKREDCYKQFYMLDTAGLITNKRKVFGLDAQKPYAAARTDLAEGLNLLETIKATKPDMLIGLSTVGKLFTEEVVREMAKHVQKPIIFPLSNPTSKSECSAEDAIKWTDGRVIFASGSPFAPVAYKGRTFIPSQGNNMFIFPGVGLGAIVSKARHVTDSMFYAAARAVAGMASQEDLDKSRIYPDVSRIREASHKVATAVAEVVWNEGLTSLPRPKDISAYVSYHIWKPTYSPLIHVKG